MKVERSPDGYEQYVIHASDIELMDLYSIVLALNHPDDDWAQPAQLSKNDDVMAVATALQVQLSNFFGQ